MIAKVVIPETWHLDYISANIRVADKMELWAMATMHPESAIRYSVDASVMVWTGLADGLPVCIFGVGKSSLLSNIGRPWMIGAKGLERYAKTFIKMNKGYVAEMLAMFPRLENYVDLRNEKAIRWLKWLGFEFTEPQLYGALNLPFMKFWMEK